MFVFRRVLALGIAFFVMAVAAGAQVGSAPNLGSKDQPLVFKSKVNLIMVPVVVRDKKGNAIATLHQEDFQLFDNGKPQVISSFSVEALAAKASPPISPLGRTKAAQPAEPSAAAPDRFIGFYIDDVHLEFGDLSQARTKLQKLISTRLKPGDRAAIFTTSGQTLLDFTDDRDKLNATALKITPHPLSVPFTCPGMTILEADRIANQADSELIAKKGREAVPTCAPDAELGKSVAMGAARLIMGAVELSVRNVLTDMRYVVRLMGEKPGQRILVLASPGFIRPSSMLGDSALIDQAIRSGVIINTLDARGLVAPHDGLPVNPMQEAAQSAILWELARGTGGKFINNTNDLGGAFAKLTEAPEVTYLLGFSPENLAPNGKFHSLKVSVKEERGLDVQARNGYYAPNHLASAGENAKEEIHKAIFGREEIHDIAIDMATELSKVSDSETKLTIVASVDITKLHYRKVDGKNSDDVEVVCGLFDRNGGYIEGVSNTITLRLVDNVTFNRENGTVPVRAEFKVAPGAYRIRLVARDSEGEMMTAQNGSVETEMSPAPAVTRISAPTLPLAPPALSQRPAAADADPILERGREKALAYTRSLPDFVCTEIIQRYKLSQSQTAVLFPGVSAASAAPSWAPIDRLTVRLSFFQQKEDHKLELVNDRPTTLQYDSLNIGATATGEFGGMMKQIFGPASQASFHWESWQKARKHRVAVYGYTVAADHSQFFVERGPRRGEVNRAVVGFHGTVEIDTETGDVLHFDYTADRIPKTVALTRSATSVDFDRVDIGGNSYILPVRSETELEGPQLALKNAIEFRAFGKFGASSTVDFGVGK